MNTNFWTPCSTVDVPLWALLFNYAPITLLRTYPYCRHTPSLPPQSSHQIALLIPESCHSQLAPLFLQDLPEGCFWRHTCVARTANCEKLCAPGNEYWMWYSAGWCNRFIHTQLKIIVDESSCTVICLRYSVHLQQPPWFQHYTSLLR